MSVTLLTEDELVKLLRVSKTTARKWATQAGARRVVCGAVRYDANAVTEALLASSGKKTARGRAVEPDSCH